MRQRIRSNTHRLDKVLKLTSAFTSNWTPLRNSFETCSGVMPVPESTTSRMSRPLFANDSASLQLGNWNSVTSSLFSSSSAHDARIATVPEGGKG